MLLSKIYWRVEVINDERSMMKKTKERTTRIYCCGGLTGGSFIFYAAFFSVVSLVDCLFNWISAVFED